MKQTVDVGDTVLVEYENELISGTVRDTYNHGMVFRLHGIAGRDFDSSRCLKLMTNSRGVEK